MNHFIKVHDMDGNLVSFRPVEIPKGQIALDSVPIHCSHAGVTRLV